MTQSKTKKKTVNRQKSCDEFMIKKIIADKDKIPKVSILDFNSYKDENKKSIKKR